MSHHRSLLKLAPRELPIDDALYAVIANAYATPPRAYHSLDHVVEVATRFDEVARDVGWAHPREVFAAVLFHDAVYVAGAQDNEAQSAALAERSLPGLEVARISALILLTARHGRIDASDVDDEAALFLDCDMAILGADARRFALYEEQIRAEYAHVPDDLYRAGRRAFLERVASAPRIFLSGHFRDRLEAQARENVGRAIATLA